MERRAYYFDPGAKTQKEIKMKKQKPKKKKQLKHNSSPSCPPCDQDCDSCHRMYPKCARCDSEAFLLSYDPDEQVLYCDCAECGLKVVKFSGVPFYDEPEGENLKDMEPEGEC